MWKVARKQEVWCSDGPPSAKEIPPSPLSAQELGGWMSERNWGHQHSCSDRFLVEPRHLPARVGLKRFCRWAVPVLR